MGSRGAVPAIGRPASPVSACGGRASITRTFERRVRYSMVDPDQKAAVEAYEEQEQVEVAPYGRHLLAPQATSPRGLAPRRPCRRQSVGPSPIAAQQKSAEQNLEVDGRGSDRLVIFLITSTNPKIESC